jgi:hypothetical protein
MKQESAQCHPKSSEKVALSLNQIYSLGLGLAANFSVNYPLHLQGSAARLLFPTDRANALGMIAPVPSIKTSKTWCSEWRNREK